MSKETKATNSKEMSFFSYLLIVLGGAGIIFLLLEIFNITTVLPAAMKSGLILSTMGIIFVVFIITGIMSISSSKVVKEQEDNYNKLYSEVTQWFMDGVTVEKLDSLLPETNEVGEEELFFMRTGVIQEIIHHRFKITDVNFLQNVSEDLYNKVYENNRKDN